MAPDGCDCFYALIPVPNQASGIDWQTQARPFRNRVMQFLESTTCRAWRRTWRPSGVHAARFRNDAGQLPRRGILL